MWRYGFLFIMGLAPLASFSGESVQTAAGTSYSNGSFSGLIYERKPDPTGEPIKLHQDELYVPETPSYVVERAKRLDQAWSELSKKLNRSVSLEATGSVRSAAERIAEQIHAPIRFDDAAFVEQGVSVDDDISIQFENISAEGAFKQLLEPHGVVAIIDGESLTITPWNTAEEVFVTRVYPVGDLVAIRDADGITADFKPLTKLIPEATGTLWVENDGAGGLVESYGQGGTFALVVFHNYQHQRDIEKLLYDLRQARSPALRKEFGKTFGDEPSLLDAAPPGGKLPPHTAQETGLIAPEQADRTVPPSPPLPIPCR